MEKHERLETGEGTLDVVYHIPENPRAWVVSLHGLESDKNGNKPILLAERLLPRGIGVVRFDFRGCGASSGEFSQTNVGTRLEDTRAVVHALAGKAGGKTLGLFGSSMGGYVALFAATDPEIAPSVRATVALASPAQLNDLVEASGSELAHLRGFVDEHLAGRYLQVPTDICNVLILHGEADETVPVAHSEDIWNRLSEPKERFLFPACDHRFSDTRDLHRAMDEAATWFCRYLLPAED